MYQQETEGTIISSISNLFLGPVTRYEPVYSNEKPDAIVIKDGKIAAIGETGRIFADYNRRDFEVINCYEKQTVCPGFVDSHTHLVFAGNRSHELKMKIQGDTYSEIAKKGGGINHTVRATRAASKEKLKEEAIERLDTMLLHGTTTIEAKSGYGLTQQDELKILEVISELNEMHTIDIIPTFLGCHVKPEDFVENAYEFIDSMIQILPEIRRHGLAEYADAWADLGAFTIEEAEVFLNAAKKEGLQLRLHADEMDNVGAGIMAANIGAVSADHLLKAEAITAGAMADAGTVANLLPATPFVLMQKKYANYQMFKDAGCDIALSTDFNPNAYFLNMQSIIGLGCFMMKMTPEEALTAATHGGAISLNRENSIGTLDLGMNADITIFDSPTVGCIPYKFGINNVVHVFKNGQHVVKDKQIVKN